MESLFDTVAAVSTPRGKGGVALLRVSGGEAREVLSRVFRPFRAERQEPWEDAGRVFFGRIVDADGNVIDEGLAVFFRAPRSFTGEDVAEITCHGGVLVTEAVLSALLAAGARLATAGEFTRRAVMNGKMKLSSAEALGALLEAKTTGQMTLARGGVSGKLGEAVESAFSELSMLLADAYAKIDFPDEDLNSLSVTDLTERMAAVRGRLSRLGDTYRTGHAVAEGLNTVICGPVNAGKSTLYNALVGRDAAIVTDVAGTTRDVLCETVALGAVTLRLFDTAGLRETPDAVEEIGVRRAREAMAGAELLLAVLDASCAEVTEEETALLSDLKCADATVVIVLNKCENGVRFPMELLKDFSHVVTLSARSGEIAPLRERVEALFLSDTLNLREDAIVSNARQYVALSRAVACLDSSLEALRRGVPLDAACTDAELAMSALGEVDGRAVDEQIVNDIFANFCVGK